MVQEAAGEPSQQIARGGPAFPLRLVCALSLGCLRWLVVDGSRTSIGCWDATPEEYPSDTNHNAVPSFETGDQLHSTKVGGTRRRWPSPYQRHCPNSQPLHSPLGTFLHPFAGGTNQHEPGSTALFLLLVLLLRGRFPQILLIIPSSSTVRQAQSFSCVLLGAQNPILSYAVNIALSISFI